MSKPRRRGKGGKWITPKRRAAIYARDNWKCVYCEEPLFHPVAIRTLDHVVPVDRGGGNESSNLLTCCSWCNTSKHNQSLRQWFRKKREAGQDTTEIIKRVRNARRRLV